MIRSGKYKNRLVTALILSVLTFSGFINAQAQAASTGDPTGAKQVVKRMRIDPAGFVSLPNGFKINRTKNWIDAWLGFIESSDGKLMISFSAGMVESFFDKYKKNFLWTRVESQPKRIEFGLLRIKKAATLVARIGWIEFSMPVKQAGDKEIFMEIVRSYDKNP